MGSGARWFLIPAMLVVLLRLLAIAGNPTATATAAPAPAEAARVAAPFADVQVRDASGERRPASLASLSAGALRLALPEQLVGQRVQLVVRRWQSGRAEAQAWLTARTRIRADAELPVAGLPAGAYEVEVRCPDGVVLRAGPVTAPGCAALPVLTPPPAPGR